MPDYQITIQFNDAAGPLVLDLADTELDTAEALAEQIRHEVQQGREVNAPAVVVRGPDGSDLVLEPLHIVSIDLEQTATTQVIDAE